MEAQVYLQDSKPAISIPKSQDVSHAGGNYVTNSKAVIKVERVRIVDGQLVKEAAGTTADQRPAVVKPKDEALQPTLAANSRVEVQPQIKTEIVSTSPKQLKKVTISSDTLGKLHLKVADVLISETVIVLVYDGSESARVEPPRAGGDNPLTLVYEQKSYTCIYGDFAVDWGSYFLVIFVRI
jgi:hypothetical protein